MASISSINDAGRFSAGLFEQVVHAAGAYPTNISTKSEPLRLKKGTWLPGHGLGQEGFPGTRRADQAGLFGNLTTQR